LPCLLAVSLLGFGYPLKRSFRSPLPRKLLSAPNALGLRSSELSSFPGVGGSFRTSLSTLALPKKTFRLSSGASVAFNSPQKSRSLLWLPEGLVRVRDLCSPELSHLSGSLFRFSLEKGPLPLLLPLALFLAPSLTRQSWMSLRVFRSDAAWRFPFQDAGPLGVSSGKLSHLLG